MKHINTWDSFFKKIINFRIYSNNSMLYIHYIYFIFFNYFFKNFVIMQYITVRQTTKSVFYYFIINIKLKFSRQNMYFIPPPCITVPPKILYILPLRFVQPIVQVLKFSFFFSSLYHVRLIIGINTPL